MHCQEESEGVRSWKESEQGQDRDGDEGGSRWSAKGVGGALRWYTLARGWSIIPSVPCFAIETSARGKGGEFLLSIPRGRAKRQERGKERERGGRGERERERVGIYPDVSNSFLQRPDAINVIISTECSRSLETLRGN